MPVRLLPRLQGGEGDGRHLPGGQPLMWSLALLLLLLLLLLP